MAARRNRRCRGVLAPLPSEMEQGVKTFHLRSRQVALPLIGADGPQSPLWLYADAPLPVIRATQGEPVRIRFTNDLPAEHSSIHWHGIRVPNAMDGVPYLTQKPVEPGSSYVYDFTPPDTGTFFFHPHCNESGQVGQGLAGILIVDGDETAPFDDDIILAAKDWRLAPDGSFLPFSTIKAPAAPAPSARCARSMAQQPSRAPCRPADLRLRLLNLDATRIDRDRHRGRGSGRSSPSTAMRSTPFPLDTWRLGSGDAAGSRGALAGAPARPSSSSTTARRMLYDLAVLTAEGAACGIAGSARAHAARLADARRPISPGRNPDLLFGWPHRIPSPVSASPRSNDPLSAVILDSLCTGDETFWSINKLSWPRDGP